MAKIKSKLSNRSITKKNRLQQYQRNNLKKRKINKHNSLKEIILRNIVKQDQDLINSINGYLIYGRDLKLLSNLTELNDAVINFYFQLLSKISNRIFYLDTHFYAALSRYFTF